MSNRPFIPLMRSRIISAAALAGLTSLALLLAVESADAREALTCGGKHGDCVGRCVRNYSTPEEAFSCERRTCDRQLENCIRDTGGTGIIREGGRGGGGGKVGGRPVGGKGGRPVGGRGGKGGSDTNIVSPAPGPGFGSILDTLGAMGQHSPAAAGSPIAPAAAPAAPPASPPVIIR